MMLSAVNVDSFGFFVIQSPIFGLSDFFDELGGGS